MSSRLVDLFSGDGGGGGGGGGGEVSRPVFERGQLVGQRPGKAAAGLVCCGRFAGPVIGEVYDKENGKKDPR